MLCGENREEVEAESERWGSEMGRRRVKANRSKTECLCVREGGGWGSVKLQGVTVGKVEKSKYSGSGVRSNGECRREV